MSTRTWSVIAACAIAAVVSSITATAVSAQPTAVPHSATLAPAADDFNGDGYADLVIGNGGSTPSSEQEVPGYVVIEPGTSTGAPDTADAVTLTASQFGLTSTDNEAEFGRGVAVGNFNGDGYADLAIGVAGADIASSQPLAHGAGAVVVLYGSASGLDVAHPQIIDQDTPGVPGLAEDGDNFGQALAVTNLNNDRYDDLVVGVPGEKLGRSTVSAGSLETFNGSATGLTATGSAVITRAQTKLPGHPVTRWGQVLAAGDFTGDGDGDVVVGSPTAEVERHKDAGRIDVLYGSAHGLSAKHAMTVTPYTAALPGAVGLQGDFGRSVATGDLNDDGRADLVVGAPAGDGAVSVLYGATSGLSLSGAQLWRQGKNDVPGQAGDPANGFNDDGFGTSVAILDASTRPQAGPAYPSVYIGVPDDLDPVELDASQFMGSIEVLPGSRLGVTAHGARVLFDPDWQPGLGSGWGQVLGGGPFITASEATVDVTGGQVRVLGVGSGRFASVAVPGVTATTLAY